MNLGRATIKKLFLIFISTSACAIKNLKPKARHFLMSKSPKNSFLIKTFPYENKIRTEHITFLSRLQFLKTRRAGKLLFTALVWTGLLGSVSLRSRLENPICFCSCSLFDGPTTTYTTFPSEWFSFSFHPSTVLD